MPWFLTKIFVFGNTFWSVHVQVLHTVEDGHFRMVGISRSKRHDQTDSIFFCRLHSGHVMDEFWSLSKNTFSHFFVGNCKQVLRFIGFINNHINGFLLWMTNQFESSTLKIIFIPVKRSELFESNNLMWPKWTLHGSKSQSSLKFFLVDNKTLTRQNICIWTQSDLIHVSDKASPHLIHDYIIFHRKNWFLPSCQWCLIGEWLRHSWRNQSAIGQQDHRHQLYQHWSGYCKDRN